MVANAFVTSQINVTEKQTWCLIHLHVSAFVIQDYRNPHLEVNRCGSQAQPAVVVSTDAVSSSVVFLFVVVLFVVCFFL